MIMYRVNHRFDRASLSEIDVIKETKCTVTFKDAYGETRQDKSTTTHQWFSDKEEALFVAKSIAESNLKQAINKVVDIQKDLDRLSELGETK